MQGIPIQNMCIRNGNTLAEDWPYFDETTQYSPLSVDAVTANPPYSANWDPNKHQSNERFNKYGFAPKGKADYAFLLHCLFHIKKDGIMAIVLPHGVLFRGGNERDIRKNLVDSHNIETIIGFPPQMFFSTGIPVIVMILSKNRSADDILFVDASKSFVKGKKQNVLRESDVQRIFDAVEDRKDIPYLFQSKRS
jgi:type I restriction enzyme M protein